MVSDDLGTDDNDAEHDEYDRLQKAFLDHIDAFAEEEDVGDPDLIGLLVDAAVRLRMASYGTYVEKPSVGGLKLDLDRFRQEIDQIIRDAKKGADEYIEMVKGARAIQDEAGHE
jgi:hypothetical protein